MIFTYTFEDLVKFTLDFLINFVRKRMTMEFRGLGRSMRFCNPGTLVDPTFVFLDKDSKSSGMRSGNGIGKESLSKAVSENITRILAD